MSGDGWARGSVLLLLIHGCVVSIGRARRGGSGHPIKGAPVEHVELAVVLRSLWVGFSGNKIRNEDSCTYKGSSGMSKGLFGVVVAVVV